MLVEVRFGLAKVEISWVEFTLYIDFVVVVGVKKVLGFPPVFLNQWFLRAGGKMLVLTQDYRGGGGGRRGGGGRGGGARCHARVRGQPLPGGRRDGALVEYVAKLCSTLVVRHRLPGQGVGALRAALPRLLPAARCRARRGQERVRALPHAHGVAVGERPRAAARTRGRVEPGTQGAQHLLFPGLRW